jgi:hypothetical protein
MICPDSSATPMFAAAVGDDATENIAWPNSGAADRKNKQTLAAALKSLF